MYKYRRRDKLTGIVDTFADAQLLFLLVESTVLPHKERGGQDARIMRMAFKFSSFHHSMLIGEYIPHTKTADYGAVALVEMRWLVIYE
jgi:hypothetical protein